MEGTSHWHRVYAIAHKHATQTHTHIYALKARCWWRFPQSSKWALDAHTHTHTLLVFWIFWWNRLFASSFVYTERTNTRRHTWVVVIRQTSSCYGENRVLTKNALDMLMTLCRPRGAKRNTHTHTLSRGTDLENLTIICGTTQRISASSHEY